MLNYIPSYIAAGHSCIFSGSVPAISGITGNDWIEQLTGKQMYCTFDSAAESVGDNSEDGKMSPKNLLVSTVTDELRIATNHQSKVIGISLKDRAAILPAGHTANGAFWLDDASGLMKGSIGMKLRRVSLMIFKKYMRQIKTAFAQLPLGIQSP
jgi:hypothetical protein